MSPVQESSKDIGETLHVSSVPLLQFYEATRILFVHKENKIIYSTILLPELPSSDILESAPEHNQHNQCLRSACTCFLLNVNDFDYIDYILGKVRTCVVVLSKMVENNISKIS